MKTLYETDFAAWLDDQIQLMKKKDFEHLDLEHLLEEMEDLADKSKETIDGHMHILLLHLLKQRVQPDRDGKSWNDSIINARVQIQNCLDRKPSLKDYPKKMLEHTYQTALRSAVKITEIEIRKFPRECPWAIEEVLGE